MRVEFRHRPETEPVIEVPVTAWSCGLHTGLVSVAEGLNGGLWDQIKERCKEKGDKLPDRSITRIMWDARGIEAEC
jgi:hypothetical protein